MVAHANSLRGLVKLIDQIDDVGIESVAIPTGIPLVYKFNRNLEPVEATDDVATKDTVGEWASG